MARISLPNIAKYQNKNSLPNKNIIRIGIKINNESQIKDLLEKGVYILTTI